MPDQVTGPARRNPTATATTKPPLAGVAEQADRIAASHPNGSRARAAALVVAVAAREMTTVPRARRLIAEHFAARPRNAGVGTAAVALLDQLTTETTTPEGTTA